MLIMTRDKDEIGWITFWHDIEIDDLYLDGDGDWTTGGKCVGGIFGIPSSEFESLFPDTRLPRKGTMRETKSLAIVN